MNRGELILKIWEFGMDHPNFSLFELEEFLKGKLFKKQLSEEDINFGIAYVKKNFIKSKDLDEYLIDQSSITGFLTHKQNEIARRTNRVAILSLIVASLSLIVASLSLYIALTNYQGSGTCHCVEKKQVQQYQTAQHDTIVPVLPVIANNSE